MTQPRPARTRVKVCGITSLEDAMLAVRNGADALGFIFVEDTPRFIEPAAAAAIIHALPPMITPVGVTRDLDVDTFCALEYECPCPIMQLHGKESEATVRACGPGVVKAFKYESVTIASQLARWGKIDEADAVLIDGSEGGEGVAFDWTELAGHLDGFNKPVVVAGGLSPDNVGEAIRAIRPFAVDVSSGVEAEPGLKDPARIAAFMDAVRDADRSS